MNFAHKEEGAARLTMLLVVSQREDWGWERDEFKASDAGRVNLKNNLLLPRVYRSHHCVRTCNYMPTVHTHVVVASATGDRPAAIFPIPINEYLRGGSAGTASVSVNGLLP